MFVLLDGRVARRIWQPSFLLAYAMTRSDPLASTCDISALMAVSLASVSRINVGRQRRNWAKSGWELRRVPSLAWRWRRHVRGTKEMPSWPPFQSVCGEGRRSYRTLLFTSYSSWLGPGSFARPFGFGDVASS